MNITCVGHSLDTCKCIRLFLVDMDLPAAQRVETPVEQYTSPAGHTHVSKRCPLHAIADPVAHAAVVMEENRRKNVALAAIEAHAKKLTKKDKDNNDEVDESLFTWTFDAARDLELDTPSLSTGEKNALRAHLTARVRVK